MIIGKRRLVRALLCSFQKRCEPYGGATSRQDGRVWVNTDFVARMIFRFSRKLDFLQRQIYNVLVIRTVTGNQANDAQLPKVPQLTSDANALHKFDTSSIEKKIVDDRPDMPKLDMKNPYVKEPVNCILCKYNVEVDYKNTKLLSQFISPFTGDMYDKSITGLCTAQHKKVTEQVKKAKLLGYMPYVYKDVTFSKDPRLFNALKSSKKFS